MERWEGCVAIVTGASSGIGKAIAEILVDKGLKVVGLARRIDKLQELKDKLDGSKGTFYPIAADITKASDVESAFSWIETNLGPIHALVNNAGVALTSIFFDTPTENWETMYNLNVVALSVMTKEAIKSMNMHKVNGHIINISSIGGHISHPFPGMATYFASKRSVNAISEGLRGELAVLKSNIKVTNISPGLVMTEIIEHSGQIFGDDTPSLAPKDIAEGVVYAMSQPPNVLVTELTIEPTRETIYALKNGTKALFE